MKILSADTTDSLKTIVEFDRFLTQSFDLGQAELRASCHSITDGDALAHAQKVAWRLYREVFAAWHDVERDVSRNLSPVDLVALRESIRAQERFELHRHTNFPDASRLLSKAFADSERLERRDERNPGAPPSLDAVYKRVPGVRGAVPPSDRTFVEVLDHAAMRLQDLDVVHERTHAAVRSLVPRIVASLSAGRPFLILDVACGGNQLARHLCLELEKIGISRSDIARVRILGIDIDPRSIPYTYAASGLGWHGPQKPIGMDVIIGNLIDPKTRDSVASWLSSCGKIGFDAVVALGILDYVGCAVPGEDRTYIPEEFAPMFGALLRHQLSPGGVLIAAVFAQEGHDKISTGARHLFANWHLEHASRERMQVRFSFLRSTDFVRLTEGARPRIDAAAHFFVHES